MKNIFYDRDTEISQSQDSCSSTINFVQKYKLQEIDEKLSSFNQTKTYLKNNNQIILPKYAEKIDKLNSISLNPTLLNPFIIDKSNSNESNVSSSSYSFEKFSKQNKNKKKSDFKHFSSLKSTEKDLFLIEKGSFGSLKSRLCNSLTSIFEKFFSHDKNFKPPYNKNNSLNSNSNSPSTINPTAINKYSYLIASEKTNWIYFCSIMFIFISLTAIFIILLKIFQKK